MKKLMFLVLVLVVAFAIGSGTVLAQQPSLDATADISAVVLEAFDVNNVDDLDFGTIVAPTDAGGTITVAPDGTSTPSGIPYHDEIVQAASFEITGGYSGTEGISYSVELPTSANITNGSGGSMIVDNFTSDLTDDAGTITSTSETFNVGATLNVGAAQEAGSYSGTFDVTVTIE